jgi:transcriptional regulator with XRE-family HTH domain
MPIRRRQQTRFGARLFLLRRQAYISREDLARRSGTSAHSIQSWEQGRAANPSLRAAFGLAQGLGVTLSKLLEGLTRTSIFPRSLLSIRTQSMAPTG